VFIKLVKENKITAVAGAIVLLLSIALEWYGRYCGFILTNDSLQYLSAAQSFGASGRFLSPDGSYYSYWPPLFPIILSWWDDVYLALSFINVVSKFCIAFVLLWMSITFFEKTFYRIIFLVASMLSVYITLISVFVWTELFFLALLLLNTYFALNHHKQRFFYWLLVTGFLLCIQRNAGLFWISGVCLWLVLDKDALFVKNLAKSSVVFLVSTSGLWVWNIYNTFFLPADFSFYKHSFFQDWMYNMMLIAETHVNMIVPFHNTIIVFLLFGTVIAFVVYILKSCSDRKLLFFISTWGMYTIGFSALAALDVYEMDRYFSVMTPIIFLVLFFCVEKFSRDLTPKLQLAMMVVMVCWLGYPITRTIKNVQFWHERSCLTESSR
jgi:hypothetical protein